MQNEQTNKEGLTFEEWVYASGRSDGKFDLGEFKAWRNGENPSEYRVQKAAE